MPRPRKYASDAERSRAYRLRKQRREQAAQPDLKALSRVIHRIYRKRVAAGEVGYEHFIGKTPFETLVRVILCEAVFERHMKDGEVYEFPGWDKLIIPIDVGGEDGTSYMVAPYKDATGVMIYLPNEAAFFGDEESEEDVSSN